MPVPRIHVDSPLRAGTELALPAHAARHVQVLRLQPGAPLCLFDGLGGEWDGEVVQMGRKGVLARVGVFHDIEREALCPVTLALGMPANDRMDTLVEKATELGVAAIQPLLCERSVLRVAGDRAERKAAHWQAIAVASCEQSGRNRVPVVAAPLALREWLATAQGSAPSAGRRLMLSLAADAEPLLQQLARLSGDGPLALLSGPEGGLSAAEQTLAVAQGFAPVSLGPRTLRADTAPLAAVAVITALEGRR
jgi:16S rRNA (uracil1498-N3)-methyltransferase